jgi:hypothetical protein
MMAIGLIAGAALALLAVVAGSWPSCLSGAAWPTLAGRGCRLERRASKSNFTDRKRRLFEL